MSLIHYLIIGSGGALGAVSRVVLTKALPETVLTSFPLQIFVVNVLGCFVMGLLVELMALYWSTHLHLRSFITTGFLGGFTTFSAFALEVGLLVEKNMHGWAIFYAILSVTLSLLAFFMGMKLVRWV
ncbi:Fluoride efflux transporter CrcB [Candidatus Bealeia paramacronuclearis]|uniref:Fluoride-specific ion channel FluC n=1 Tax=Candidatus Bealeia paramacronuclearis TaxID=1921001 RepID=A0ABZ2C7P0_9PROT|nr:Fluoride efflux transporter CrcB [Candidatus Bealeia paramacronuclearis]